MINWQRLLSKGSTCPRCGSTENELEKAIPALEKLLTPLGIKVVLEKSEISEAEFKVNPAISNRILLNNKPLEEYLNANTSQSQCCEVCGDSKCRTIELEDKTYEVIPQDLIVRAGLIAASQLVSL